MYILLKIFAVNEDEAMTYLSQKGIHNERKMKLSDKLVLLERRMKLKHAAFTLASSSLYFFFIVSQTTCEPHLQIKMYIISLIWKHKLV